MKTFCLAVIVLIACFSCAEALRCNRCVPSVPGGRCTTTVEECKAPKDVCVYVVMPRPTYSYFKRCIEKPNAQIMAANHNFQVTICSTDLCN